MVLSILLTNYLKYGQSFRNLPHSWFNSHLLQWNICGFRRHKYARAVARVIAGMWAVVIRLHPRKRTLPSHHTFFCLHSEPDETHWEWAGKLSSHRKCLFNAKIIQIWKIQVGIGKYSQFLYYSTPQFLNKYNKMKQKA